MDAIMAVGLSKSYPGKADALHGLDLTVPEGGVCGFLGPNGAGKTTTVKLLTGLLKPSAGKCAVSGFSPVEEPVKVHKLCGVMTETARLYGHMTGIQNLLFFAEANGMEHKESLERAEALLKQLDIFDARDRKVSAYSTGMTQRLSLARALIHRPKVLFLDEPTSGLDPESAQAVNEMISKLSKQEGATVFLCTHQLRYAQDLCTAYGIIDQGKMLASGSFQALFKTAGCRLKAAFRLKDGDRLEGFEKGDGNWWVAEIREEGQMPALLQKAVAGHEVFEARVVTPSLEDIYFSFIGTEGRHPA